MYFLWIWKITAKFRFNALYCRSKYVITNAISCQNSDMLSSWTHVSNKNMDDFQKTLTSKITRSYSSSNILPFWKKTYILFMVTYFWYSRDDSFLVYINLLQLKMKPGKALCCFGGYITIYVLPPIYTDFKCNLHCQCVFLLEM